MDNYTIVLDNLKSNNLNGHLAKDKDDAREIALSMIKNGDSIGFGGSLSVDQVGLKDELVRMGKSGYLTVFNPYEDGLTREESINMRHRGMQADVFVTGTNAITEAGELVNIDGYGNRVAAMICGPKKVIVIVGRNKIVRDFDAALERIRKEAAPLNAKRLNKLTPCVKTGRCMDCKTPQRICNSLVKIWGSYDPDRIHVIIVDEELGL